MSDYERGQQDVAQEVYDIIFNRENYEWQLIHRTDSELIYHFNTIITNI